MDPATIIVIILAIAFLSFVVYLAVVSRKGQNERTRIEKRPDEAQRKGRG